MSNTIQIKRGAGKPDGKLAPYELGYNTKEGFLYIGGELVDDTKEGAEEGAKVYGLANGIKVDFATNATNAEKAKILATSREIGVDLASTEFAKFDGQSNIITGVTGTLPVNKGGTGTTTIDGAKALLGITRANLVDLIYPVGSIYMSINTAPPAELFGGIWEQIEDRFLLAAGSSYAAGTTGGKATHTLTISEMPIHAHDQKSLVTGFSDWATTTLDQYSTYFPFDSGFYTQTGGEKHTAEVSANTDTGEAGSGQAHNNMPPYLVVFIWKRIA